MGSLFVRTPNSSGLPVCSRSRESYCFHHVQAIMLTIDQYAESALGNRQYFLNKPHSIGGKNDKIP
jgi:hypothetical protein